MRTKELWHGIFNWHGEVHEFYTKAASCAQAFTFMSQKLAERLKVAHWSVWCYYMGSHAKGSFEIKAERTTCRNK